MTAPTELEKLAEDWITLWQSELAGMAADPELAEAWAAAVAMGAAWWRAQAMGAQAMGAGRPPMAGLMSAVPFAWPGGAAVSGSNPWAGPADEDPATTRTVITPRSTAAGAASDGQRDAGGGGLDDSAMAARLAALERRLAEIEGGAGGTAADPPAPRRRKRKS